MNADHNRRIVYYKTVYVGAGLCGKTTNLQQLEKIIPPTNRSQLITFDTKGDRTLFFDNLDFNIGKRGTYDVRLRFYTVPGQAHYAATRQAVLEDVDAIVFVADSQPDVFESNIQSLRELEGFLAERSIDINKIPFVLQLNKRDIPGVVPEKELAGVLQINNAPYVLAVATEGIGVQETMHQILRQLMPVIHGKNKVA